jgi:hypothetical protein
VSPITDVTGTAIREEEMAVRCRLFGTNMLKDGAILHVDPLLGNDHEISKYTRAVAE